MNSLSFLPTHFFTAFSVDLKFLIPFGKAQVVDLALFIPLIVKIILYANFAYM